MEAASRPHEILDARLPEPLTEGRDLERWFEPLKRRMMVAVQRVHAGVTAALDAARERILEREGGHRDVWFVTGTDGASLMKSIASVRSKLGRELGELDDSGRLPRGRMSVDQVEQLLLSFVDLAAGSGSSAISPVTSRKRWRCWFRIVRRSWDAIRWQER